MPVSSLLELSLTDPALEADVRADLERTEALLRDAAKSDYGFLDQASHHLADAGGKRFRALLTFLAAYAASDGAALPDSVTGAAVAIELTHLSTLYHDDVMDEATLRRGAEAANRRWTNTVAILTGDYLFARASELTADLGAESTRILARTIATLVEGQIRETMGPDNDVDLLAHYLRVVGDKTGSLIATSARLGAMLAGGSEDLIERLTRYAGLIGISFQLADDILDVTSASLELGKPQGADVREGILSLPVVLAASADRAVYAQVRGDLTAPGAFEAALAALRGSPVIGDAVALARSYAERARAELDGVPPSAARGALELLCDVVVERTS